MFVKLDNYNNHFVPIIRRKFIKRDCKNVLINEYNFSLIRVTENKYYSF